VTLVLLTWSWLRCKVLATTWRKESTVALAAAVAAVLQRDSAAHEARVAPQCGKGQQAAAVGEISLKLREPPSRSLAL
jgi:hypothetical protein